MYIGSTGLFFRAGGTVGAMAKTRNMKVKLKAEKAEIKVAMTEKERQIQNIQKEMEQVRKSNLISSLDTKLRSGAKLTDEELKYLKANSPELYKQAIEIKREREEYKRALKSCRTKEDVARLNESKLQRFTAEIKAIRSSSLPKGKKEELMLQIERRVAGILNEHTQFLATQEYGELPTDKEYAQGKRKRNRPEEDDVIRSGERIHDEPETAAAQASDTNSSDGSAEAAGGTDAAASQASSDTAGTT